MESLRVAWETAGVAGETLLQARRARAPAISAAPAAARPPPLTALPRLPPPQKLWMWRLPELALVGGPAEGLTVVITGPTSGIGAAAAAELARRGARVVLACRDAARGEALRARLEAAARAGGAAAPRLEVALLDVASAASVRAFAAAFLARGEPLHALVLNAGVFSMGAPRAETPDGHEAHLGTNHLGHFLLALLLLPALRAAGAAPGGRPARVVAVSSRMHLLGRLRRADMQLLHNYSPTAAYAQSKLAQVAFCAELSRRARGAVRAVALHPGEVLTDVVRSLPGPLQALYRAAMPVLLLSPAQGARATLHCATAAALAPGGAEAGELYYDSNCAPGRAAAEALDAGAGAWLWAWSVAAVGLRPEEDLPPVDGEI